MLCSSCGKASAKTYERKVGGKELTVHLCPACYEKLCGTAMDTVFATLHGDTLGKPGVCPICGTTAEEFRRTGLLGCSYCYTALREDITPFVRRIQHKLFHLGKSPSTEAEEKYDVVRELVYQQESLQERIRQAKRERNVAEVQRLREQLEKINRKLYGGEGD